MERKYNNSVNYTVFDKLYQEDLDNRKLFINDEIDSNVIENIAYHIFRYNSQDVEKPIEDRVPIVLFINTPGGPL